MNDREEGLVGFCSADTVQELLEATEKALAEGTMDWRTKSKR